MPAAASAAIEACADLTCVLIVGSRSRVDREARDLDLLALHGGTDSEPVLDAVAGLLGPLSTEPGWRSGDATRIRFGDDELSVAVHPEQATVAFLERFAAGGEVAGERTVWAASARLPESFAADVCHSVPVFDRAGVHPALVGLVDPYPPLARAAIGAHCIEEVLLKCGQLIGISEPDRSIVEHLLLADVIAALVRLTYVLEGTYLHGFKRIGVPEQLRDPRASCGLTHALRLVAGGREWQRDDLIGAERFVRGLEVAR